MSVPKKSVKSFKETKPTGEKKTSNSKDKNSEVVPQQTISFKTTTPIPQSAPKADYSQLPEEQAKIITALQKKSLTFDEIVKKKLCETDRVYEVLLDMELDGLIEKIAGDRYKII
jgi:predicted Rossmann fold nucleotide-binding protein DprA/Smf involved in DNA uptake